MRDKTIGKRMRKDEKEREKERMRRRENARYERNSSKEKERGKWNMQQVCHVSTVHFTSDSHVSPNSKNIVFSDDELVLRGAAPLAGVRSSDGSLLKTPNNPAVWPRNLSGAPTVTLSWASFTLIVRENPKTTSDIKRHVTNPKNPSNEI